MTSLPYPGLIKAWLAYIRPQTFGVALSPVIAALAWVFYTTHHIDIMTAILTLTMAILMQTITNMENDVGYTERKAETGNRKGFPRATANGWISIPVAKAGMYVAMGLGFLNTMALVAIGGWGFLAIGIASIVAAWAYMGGPKPIAYTPWGELTVLVFFGLTAVMGTIYLQVFTLDIMSVLLGLMIGSLAAVVLAVNNWRDREHDLSIGRFTMAGVLSEKQFLVAFNAMLLFPFFGVIIMVTQDPKAFPLLLPLVLIQTLRPIRTGLLSKQGVELNSVLVACVKLALKFSLLFAIGALLSYAFAVYLT